MKTPELYIQKKFKRWAAAVIPVFDFNNMEKQFTKAQKAPNRDLILSSQNLSRRKRGLPET